MENSVFYNEKYSDLVNEVFKARNHIKATYGSDFLTNDLTVIILQMGIKIIAPYDRDSLRDVIAYCKKAEKWICFLNDNGFYTDKALLEKCKDYEFYLTFTSELIEKIGNSRRK